MKKLLLAIVAIGASVGVLAQGTVNFDTSFAALGGPIPGLPIYDADGTTPLSGDSAWAQLYAGPDAGSLAPIGAAVNFLTGDFAGIIAAGTRAIPTVAPGAAAIIDVRAWEAAGGASYEAALAGGFKVGANSLGGGTFSVLTGGAGTPPSLPANLVGFQSFSLVPEPSTTALGILGAVALLLRRRK